MGFDTRRKQERKIEFPRVIPEDFYLIVPDIGGPWSRVKVHFDVIEIPRVIGHGNTADGTVDDCRLTLDNRQIFLLAAVIN